MAAYSWILLFTRGEGESVAETLQRERHPEPLKCYNYEWQGEAICWLNNYTFYTTSDADDGNPPIYIYRKPYPEAVETVADGKQALASKVLSDGRLLIRNASGLYTLDGRKVE